MMRKAGGTRLLLPVAAVLALGLITGCGAGGDDEGAPIKGAQSGRAPDSGRSPDAGRSPESGQASSTPADAPTARQDLDEMILATTDVPHYTVKPASVKDLSSPGKETSKQAACQPIAAVIDGVPQPKPTRIRYRRLQPGPEVEAGNGLSLFETLAAYEPEDAEQMLKRLRTAVRACASGFTTANAGSTRTYPGVKEATAPGGADDALAFRVDTDIKVDGVMSPMEFAVIRSGSTVAVFSSLNLQDPAKARIPRSVTGAQIDKLT